MPTLPEADPVLTIPPGVIYCTDRAQANGFAYGKPEWANMGQGAPETGPLPGASPRPTGIEFTDDLIHEYAPTVGVKELREAVAVSRPVLRGGRASAKGFVLIRSLRTSTTTSTARARSRSTPTRTSASSPVDGLACPVLLP